MHGVRKAEMKSEAEVRHGGASMNSIVRVGKEIRGRVTWTTDKVVPV